MNRILRYLYVAFCVTVLCSGWRICCAETPPQTPTLSEIIFIGLRPIKDLDPAHYSKEGRHCIKNYLAAVGPDSSLWALEPFSTPEKALLVRRRVMVEQMVAILGRGVRAEAEAFAYSVPLVIEWEGMSEGPVEEANFVDNWWSERPGTPITPFLHLFKAHRLRAGYEAARARHEKDLWPILAGLYRESMNKARSSTNPLIHCIADDLEAQPFVYLEGQGRP
ncbi:MAG TPA: hypothetical protein PK250_19210 [Syntrophobacter fumaroxidans]|nr:hypothetical protein [Syntrophobacter fumaroxidans]